MNVYTVNDCPVCQTLESLCKGYDGTLRERYHKLLREHRHEEHAAEISYSQLKH